MEDNSTHGKLRTRIVIGGFIIFSIGLLLAVIYCI